jgi:hypothetical protein
MMAELSLELVHVGTVNGLTAADVRAPLGDVLLERSIKCRHEYVNYFKIESIACQGGPGTAYMAERTGGQSIDLQAFVSDQKLSWTQTLDGEYVALANPEVSWTVIGPIVTLYRVIGFPTYVVVGKDGTIAAARVATGDLDAELAKLFDRKP